MLHMLQATCDSPPTMLYYTYDPCTKCYLWIICTSMHLRMLL